MFACFLGACAGEDPHLPELTRHLSEGERLLVERGSRVYRGTCVSCHSFDPREDGPVGPSLSGSSLRLLEARILEASYPEGYEPKRSTHKMTKMPQLSSQIPALHSYLKAYQDLDGEAQQQGAQKP